MTAPVTPTSRRTLLTGVAGFGALGALAGPAAAQSALGDPSVPGVPGDYFLKLTGIPGDSVRDGHEDEIELLTFGWGISQAPATKDSKPVVSHEPFLFAARWGIHSPLLYQHLLAAQRIESAVLQARRTIEGETSDYFRIAMTGCLVSSYQVTPYAADAQVMDLVELTFSTPPSLTMPD